MFVKFGPAAAAAFSESWGLNGPGDIFPNATSCPPSLAIRPRAFSMEGKMTEMETNDEERGEAAECGKK